MVSSDVPRDPHIANSDRLLSRARHNPFRGSRARSRDPRWCRGLARGRRCWHGRRFRATSNIDGHFQKAGFDDEHIVECHGTIDFNLSSLEGARVVAIECGLRPSGTLIRINPLEPQIPPGHLGFAGGALELIDAYIQG
jgi:hypothetical protein